MLSRDELMHHLEENTGVLQSPSVDHAFRAVDRADFVDTNYAVEAYEDYPLPIGHNATISQPTTVAFMLEKLDAKRGDKVLDIGAGSGWTTALLADIVGDEGTVYGVERVQALVRKGSKNLEKYTKGSATIRMADEGLGLPSEAPFNRILVSAASDELPDTLVEQLAEGGTMVIPIGNAIEIINKKTGGTLERESFAGFSFVPLVGN